MIEPIPTYAEEAYAILYNRFGMQKFSPSYFRWFLSDSMIKKIFHVLQSKGWIQRVGRGEYICKTPEQIIKNMVEFKVPELLKSSKRKYAYTRMSAVEIWTDFTYIQRSWEHSPYYIKVLKNDIKSWIRFFRSHKIPIFINNPKAALGEFVVLIPAERIAAKIFNGYPVDHIKAVVEFCKRNIAMFEYPLSYLIKKFELSEDVDIDSRIAKEVASVV